jgi:hypothetical protein
LLARDLSTLPGIDFTFDVGDLRSGLPESDGSVDLAICLYSVLSHLPAAALPEVAREIARVTSGYFITTVRSGGSPPSAFAHSMEKIRQLKQDHARNECEIELWDGRRTSFASHLFTACELRSHFSDHFHIEDLRGLDLFHSRFVPDTRWNPAICQPIFIFARN